MASNPGPYRTARLFHEVVVMPLGLGIVTGQGADYRVLAVMVPDGKETDEDLATAALFSRAPQMKELLKSAAEELANLHEAYRHLVGMGPCVNGVVVEIEELLADIEVAE